VIRRAALAILALVVASCVASGPRLVGTELPKNLAPDFTLTDAMTGQSVTLSSLRDRVVALTFLYTRCPDVCPITAGEFRAAQRALGGEASGIEFVAVSVDPEGDTPAAVRAFSEAHDLRDHWHYLIGPRAQLQTVWAAYGMSTIPSPTGMAVAHNDAIYLIDPEGRERVLMHSDASLDALVSNLRALWRER